MLYKNLPKINEGHTEIFNWPYLFIGGPVRILRNIAMELKFLQGAHFNALYIQYCGLKFILVRFFFFVSNGDLSPSFHFPIPFPPYESNYRILT